MELTISESILSRPSLALIAGLYGSVGQTGAAGFMALSSLTPETIKPTKRTLNVLVSGVVALRFDHAEHVPGTVLWPSFSLDSDRL